MGSLQFIPTLTHRRHGQTTAADSQVMARSPGRPKADPGDPGPSRISEPEPMSIISIFAGSPNHEEDQIPHSYCTGNPTCLLRGDVVQGRRSYQSCVPSEIFIIKAQQTHAKQLQRRHLVDPLMRRSSTPDYLGYHLEKRLGKRGHLRLSWPVPAGPGFLRDDDALRPVPSIERSFRCTLCLEGRCL